MIVRLAHCALIGNKGSNRAATVRVSANSKFLYATTRGSRNGSSKGYLAAFALKDDGSIASQNYITPTTTSGGGSNQVVPSTFDDNYFAILDSATGFVEMWKQNENGTGAAVVAHLDLAEKTISKGDLCCSNAVWYS
jgi:carboxy-cis,cis-muconate cyclase